MNKMCLYILAVLFLNNSCKKKEVSAENNCPEIETSLATDEIKILSLATDRVLKDGETAVFTVSGEYLLTTKDSAEVSIGFNNYYSPISYTMLPGVSKVIAKGAGVFEFTVEAMVKNWGTSGNFNCYVILSPYPEAKGLWSPYEYDTYTLLPKSE